MRIHYFMHVPFEGPGTIERWAASRDHEIQGTRLYRNDPFPELDHLDWLVVMGGPMSVHDEEQYPWLVAEKAVIRQAIDAEKVVLGICLGAQLIAEVLGGEVTRNQFVEIGWFPVRATDGATVHPAFRALPDEYVPFHWHGDTFEIPPGATRVAESDGCSNQAMVYGDRVIGLQFHLESTTETVDGLLQHANDHPGTGRYVQDPETIRTTGHLEQLADQLMVVLDTLERETAV